MINQEFHTMFKFFDMFMGKQVSGGQFMATNDTSVIDDGWLIG